MKIVEIYQYSEKIHEALNSLLPQLSSSAALLSETYIIKIIRSDSSHLLMAEENGQFIGSLTLVTFYTPTGIRAWIEDVVVDKEARCKGVGRLLSEYAVSLARKLGARTVDLTSSPSRKAANILYKKAGFSIRDTNVYRYDFS